jgi:hypothetical protein
MKRIKRLFPLMLLAGFSFFLGVCTDTVIRSMPAKTVVFEKSRPEPGTAADRAAATAPADENNAVVRPSGPPSSRTARASRAPEALKECAVLSPVSSAQVSVPRPMDSALDETPEPHSDETGREPLEAGSVDDPENAGEIGIRIVQIATKEDVEIVLTPEASGDESNNTMRFRLAGNSDDHPYSLMVRTLDKTGAEFIQFLPWNPENPNLFPLHSPLRGYASVAVYQTQNLIGRFVVTDLSGRETIPLDLDLCRSTLLARL